jgi:formylglycine-generating enzyme required for sulfatase activity
MLSGQRTEAEKDKSHGSALIPILIALTLLCACEKEPAEIPEEPQAPKSMEELIDGMALIPAGEFMMGTPQGKGRADESPQHRVSLDSFYMDKCEVTVGQYKEFLRATGHSSPPKWALDYPISDNHPWTPRYAITDNHPIVGVSWEDANAYARWAGKRLPTEAEWEYACRAGSTGEYTSGDYEDALSEHAWYWFNSHEKPHPVGQKKPNAWGLYDMHGNGSEYCSDRYSSGYYRRSPTNNPKGPIFGSTRVVRGGAWYDSATYVRSAARGSVSPEGWDQYGGFRCVLDAE